MIDAQARDGLVSCHFCFGLVTVVCPVLVVWRHSSHSAQTHPVLLFGRSEWLVYPRPGPLIAVCDFALITARDTSRLVLVDAPVMPRDVPAKEGSWSRDTRPVQPSTAPHLVPRRTAGIATLNMNPKAEAPKGTAELPTE